MALLAIASAALVAATRVENVVVAMAAAPTSQPGADGSGRVRPGGHAADSHSPRPRRAGRDGAIKSQIVGVIDGDTIRVRPLKPARKSSYIVRLIGIETPETTRASGECGGRDAMSSMLALGFSHPRDTDGDARFDRPGGRGRKVSLVMDPSQERLDRAGRLYAYADLGGGGTLAAAQLSRGWASVSASAKRFSRSKAFRKAEALARRASRGAWGLCNGNFHLPLVEPQAPLASPAPLPPALAPLVPEPAPCADGTDNDGDGKPDHPADPGCSDPADQDETDPPACADGTDNDGDGDADLVDRGCTDAQDADEGNILPPGTLTWSDEFGAPAGTAPNSANWTMRTGGRWSGGRELQCYTKRPENISHDGQGNLRVTARYEPANTFCADGPNDYTSGRIDSLAKREFQYGTIEARMKLSGGVGTWPAFWMVGDSTPGFELWPARGEVDILEGKGIEPGRAHHALHGATNTGAHWQRTGDTFGDDYTAGWHVFGIKWTENRIEFQVDGVGGYTRTPTDIPATAPWVFNKEFHLLLNMAIGGYGGTPDPADYPRELLVDWVRVYQVP